MEMSQFHYLPLTPGFFSILVGIFGIVFLLLQLGALRYAYLSLGISSGAAMRLLVGSLIGSYFNIPIAVLPAQQVMSDQTVNFFGMEYAVPVVVNWPGTVIAVNVGGAVIPTAMSIYLLAKYQLWTKGLIAIAVVALIIHWLANPVPGLGIAVPVFMPAVITAIVAVLLSREEAAPLAYIGGGLGTLIGADITNLDKVRGPRRAGRLDRRRRNVRRHFPHRHPRRPAGEPLCSTAASRNQPRLMTMADKSSAPKLPNRDPGAITDYHAHIYYDPAKTRGKAERLRERVATAFPQAKLGRWHDELVGPHPQSMFQIAFPVEMLAGFVPWLMLNRDGLTILLHPETGDDYTDHSAHAAWFGAVLPLRLDVFGKRE